MLQKARCGAGVGGGGEGGGGVPNPQADIRRALKPLPDGRLPTLDEIMHIATTVPEGGVLVKNTTQVRRIDHGVQITTVCGSAHVKIYPSSGTVHICGRAPAVGLRFVESWTVECVGAPRSKKRRMT